MALIRGTSLCNDWRASSMADKYGITVQEGRELKLQNSIDVSDATAQKLVDDEMATIVSTDTKRAKHKSGEESED